MELEGRVGRLTHELDHHAYPTISAWVEKHNRYATWEAEMREHFLTEPIPEGIGRQEAVAATAETALPAVAVAVH